MKVEKFEIALLFKPGAINALAEATNIIGYYAKDADTVVPLVEKNKRLLYPIKKDDVEYGMADHYTITTVLEYGVLNEIEKKLQAVDGILRYLVCVDNKKGVEK